MRPLISGLLPCTLLLVACGGGDDDGGSSPTADPVHMEIERNQAQPLSQLPTDETDPVRRAVRVLFACGEIDLGDHLSLLDIDEQVEGSGGGSFDFRETIDEEVDVDADGDVDFAVDGPVANYGEVEEVTQDGDTEYYGEWTIEADLSASVLGGRPSYEDGDLTLTLTSGAFDGNMDVTVTHSPSATITVGTLYAQEYRALAGEWMDAQGSGTVVVDGGGALTPVDGGDTFQYRASLDVAFGDGTSVRIEGEGPVELSWPFEEAVEFWVRVGETVYGPFTNDEITALAGNA
ncbi:MAG: hypothetical protein ACOCXA_04645 [Planctomycetota bacterium]